MSENEIIFLKESNRNYQETIKYLETRLAAYQKLKIESEKIAAWLIRLAVSAEKSAETTYIETMKEAWTADAKNYRATAAYSLRLIADIERLEGKEGKLL